MRALVLTLCALSASCSLDLDRLRRGAPDGGLPPRDAAVDAAVDAGEEPDAGDAGPADAGVCGCRGAGWQSNPFVVGGEGVSAVEVEDLNGDGYGDIVASLRGSSGPGVAFLRVDVTGCDRSGLSAEAAEALAGTVPNTVSTLVDWDGDGTLDVLSPDPAMDRIQYLRGNVSTMRWSASPNATFGGLARPRVAFAGELDGAGLPEVVIAGEGNLAYTAPDRSLTSTRTFPPIGDSAGFGRYPDGRRFVALVGVGVGVLVHVFDPTDEPTLQPGLVVDAPGITAVEVGDLFPERSGDEIVVSDGSSLRVFGYDATGWVEIASAAARPFVALRLGNVDPDPELELAAASQDRGWVELWNAEDGGLSTRASLTVGEPTALALADVDADGQGDVIVGHSASGSARITVFRQVCAR